MSAEDYNRIRRILFSTVHKSGKGFSAANEYLDATYRKQLDHKGYVGLRAELTFYERHLKEFALTVAGDMGEHADFAGAMGGEATRFDVTTNIRFKRFADYEPYLGDGPRYKIALLDAGTFELVDVYDLAFARCEDCGGHQMPAFVLLSQNLSASGESRWANDQLLLDVCVVCKQYVERERFTHHGLLSIEEFMDAAGGDDTLDVASLAKRYALDAYKSFRRRFANDHLMAVGSPSYRVTDKDGDGRWEVNFGFINNAVSRDMPAAIAFTIS